ncbi:MAG: hypothetical protein CL525_13190, partial [Aequorivita sp.]|nr:hypothetical protein [Aequorivita sp.]
MSILLNNKKTTIYRNNSLTKTFKRRLLRAYKDGSDIPSSIPIILKKENMIFNPTTKRFNNRTRYIKQRKKFIKNNIQDVLSSDLDLLEQENLYFKVDTKRFVKRSRLSFYTKKNYILSDFILSKQSETVQQMIYKYPVEDHRSFFMEDYNVYADDMPNVYLDTTIKSWFRDMYDDILSLESVQVTIITTNQNNNNVVFKRIINVNTNKTFNTGFWNDVRSLFYTGSAGDMILTHYETAVLMVSKMLPFNDAYIIQNYLDSINEHCFFAPILNWAMNCRDKAKGLSTKRKYNSIVNKVKNYITIYEDGLPENKIQDICDDLSIDISIGNTVSKIFGKQYAHFKTTKKKYGLKHFKFINTRNNHLEYLVCENQEVINIETPEEMESIMQNITNLGRTVPFYKSNGVYLWINDVSTKYQLNSEYKKSVEEFEKLNHLQYHKLEEGTEISNIIQNSVRIPVSCDVNNIFSIDDEDEELCPLDVGFNQMKYNQFTNDKLFNNIKMFDQQKSFYNFDKCPYYNGFCLNPHTVIYNNIPLEDVLSSKEQGFYKIDNIDYSKASNIDSFFFKKYIVNDSFLPQPVLKALHNHKISFDIVGAVYGVKGNIKFTKNMTQKIDKVPFYSIWVGNQISCKQFSSIQFNNNDRNLISSIYKQIRESGVTAKAYENVYEKKISIEYKKEKVFHRAHIASYIYAYTALSMLEMITQFKQEDVLKLNVDAFYLKNADQYNVNCLAMYEHEPDRDNEKSKKYLLSKCNHSENYIVFKWWHKLNIIKTKYRKNHRIKLLLGAGGVGKSYSIFNDPAILEKSYCAHANRLSRYAVEDYKNINHSCPFQHLLANKSHLQDIVLKQQGLLFIDEASFISYGQILQLFHISQKYSICMIFAGDIGFQTAPPINDGKTAKDRLNLFKIKDDSLKINYRFKDDKAHNDAILQVRKMMTDKKKSKDILKYLIHDQKYKCINSYYMIKNIKIDDTLLSSRHKFNELYDRTLSKKFTNKKKYMMKKTNAKYSNGDIIISDQKISGSVERYAFTIHSTQGTTIKDGNNLYIDTRELK